MTEARALKVITATYAAVAAVTLGIAVYVLVAAAGDPSRHAWALGLVFLMLALDVLLMTRLNKVVALLCNARNGARHARRTSRNDRNDPAEACDCPRCEDDHPYL